MYTVDRIENNIVVLENRDTKDIFEINIEEFTYDVKEGDIVDLIDNKYLKNVKLTNLIKKDIRSRFDSLKK